MVVCGKPSRIGVAMTAGEIALTVMSPCPASSLARDFVKQISAALLAEEGPSVGLPSLPAIEAMLTMRPYFRSRMLLTTALQHRTGPTTLTDSTFSQSSLESSQSLPALPVMPALLTRISTGPAWSRTSSTAVSTSASQVTSPATACPPMASATRWAAAALRSKTPTFAPAAASRRQIASPMPCPPPVTKATLPSRRKNDSMQFDFPFHAYPDLSPQRHRGTKKRIQRKPKQGQRAVSFIGEWFFQAQLTLPIGFLCGSVSLW